MKMPGASGRGPVNAVYREVDRQERAKKRTMCEPDLQIGNPGQNPNMSAKGQRPKLRCF
jgi:hypothetical protein